MTSKQQRGPNGITVAWLSQRLAGLLVIAICLSSVPLQAQASEDGSPGAWQFAGEIYLWGAEIDATTPGGSSIALPFDDILDNLEMTFMGVFAARKDKWTFLADVIYLDLSHDKGFARTVPAISGTAKAELTSWIFTPAAAYNVIDTEQYRLDLLGGLRYLDVEAKLNLNLSGPNPGGVQLSGKDSFDDWNGIVGAKGRVHLTEHWYLAGYADVGTGDSDLTWQVIGSVGYRFDRLELNGGYRYLDWELDDGGNDLLADLTIKGPFAGVMYRF